MGAGLIPRSALVSARISPVVWASPFSRPRVLLPGELWGRLDSSQQDAVIIHELAHLKRRDHWVRWLEVVVLGIYWWNPVAWWARRELERYEEEACDAWVVSSQPKAASAFAEALVATTAFLSGVSLQLPAGASGVTNTLSLKRRLSMLLSHTASVPMTRSRSWTVLLLGTLCLPLLPVPSSGETAGSAAALAPRESPVNSEQVNSATLQVPAPSSDPQRDQSRVRVTRPINRRVGQYADVDGRLQAAVRVEIKAAVGGMLNRVACRTGQRVKKGDVLFEIDPRAYALELQKAEAEVRRLQSRVRNIGVQARAVDRAKQDVRENLARVQAEQDEAEAVLLGAQATLDLAKLKLDSTKVTSPIDGVVSKLFQSEGEIVEAEQTGLARIVATNLLTADVYVEEAVAQRIEQARANREKSAGDFVRVAVRDEAGFPHPASIGFVDFEVQPVAEAAVRVSVLVPNPDGALRSGQIARVRIILGPPRDSLLVPWDAFKMDAEPRYLYVFSDKNVVERRRVQAPLRYDSLRAVESGLRAEEWVIVDGKGASLVGTTIDPRKVDRIEPPKESAEKPSSQ